MKKDNYIKKRNILLIILGVLLLGLLGLIIEFVLRDEIIIKLKGEDPLYVKVGEKYIEPGYNIITKNKKKKYSMVISSSLDTDVIGEYIITYKVLDYEKTRKVIVIDDIKPEITLTGNDLSYYCPSKEYKEEGFKAIDNYDGDITDKVKVVKEKDKIIYSVKDSSLNESIKVRNLEEGDHEGPKFIFNKDVLTLYQGNKYKDDYKVIDNCDGDITDKVKVLDSVSTSSVKEYSIRYEVSDKSGNITKVSRKVKVLPKPKGRSIYLTFDDGPSNDITPKVLDLLKKYGINATFFVINHNNTDKLIKRAYDEGHTIGLHSYTHRYGSVYSSDEAFFNDLNAIEKKVISITGNSSKIIRFPGGSSNTVSKNYSKGIMSRLTSEVERRGYVYQDWNVGSSDTSTQDPVRICNNVKNRLGNGYNIVLMHDFSGHNGTLNALPCIIEYGIDNGYSFYPLTKDSPVSHHYVAN